ncbi:hypothetical protein [Lysinibacillus sphaericus]|uniref:hypothetical protein n=1 Tax=Lysinibacillus sphaericus TaxID=1421 RepID=UPI001CC09C5B|nr:hypothetical protein [Lysinibacillus sphaericus]
MEAGRLLGDQRLIGRPQEALLCASAANVLSVRKRSDSNKCFICAKAKRQRQSAKSERKSTTCYGDELLFFYKFNNLTFYCRRKAKTLVA